MKNLFKRHLPTEDYIKQQRQLKFLSKYLHHKDFWHMNEKSVAHALLVGLFAAVIPIPGQMLLAVLLGIPLRANLLLCVALVWISNPLTMVPIGFTAYWVGRFFLHSPPIPFHDVHYFFKHLHLIWEPFLMGSILLGLMLGASGYVLTRVFWRFVIRKKPIPQTPGRPE